MSAIPRELPGVYREDRYPLRKPPLRTGIPVFLGLVSFAPDENAEWEIRRHQFYTHPIPIRSEQEFASAFKGTTGYLLATGLGFFRNGGRFCYVLPMPKMSQDALEQALSVIAELGDADLICAPDLMWAYKQEAITETDLVILQTTLLAHCRERGTCFAILDSFEDDADSRVTTQRSVLIQSDGRYGALYYPWLRPLDRTESVPPCGHIAGVYARMDLTTGVHKAPANERIEDVLDLSTQLDVFQQKAFRAQHINYLLGLRGRGIRAMGAYTLAITQEWSYLTTTRLFIKIARWTDRFLSDVAFRNNDIYLWTHIEGQLTIFLYGLVQHGEIKNFFVRCNADTNPPENREMGLVVTQIGLAPSIPTEFIIISITHGEGAVTFTTLG
jgi:phage tail sheath protein FI